MKKHKEPDKRAYPTFIFFLNKKRIRRKMIKILIKSDIIVYEQPH